MSRRGALDAGLALLLLVLALALRLPHADLAEWKGDEAIQWLKARAIAREGERPTRGLQTTDGPRMPVHNLYLLAAPLVLDDRPEAIRVGVALLASGATVLAFLLGKRDLGRRAALAGAVLLAVLPDLVRRGRWSWNPNLVPPLALLLLVLVVRAWRRPRGRSVALVLPTATLLALIHFSPLGAAALAVLVTFRAALAGAARWVLGVALALSCALALPHVASEAGSGFQETRRALTVAGAKKDPPTAYATKLREGLALRAFAGALGPAGEADALARSHVGALEPALSLVLLGLVVSGGALGWRRPEARPVLAFLLASAAPFVLLGLPAREHYVPVGVVAGIVLAGVALAQRPRAAGAALLLALAGSSVLLHRGVMAAIGAGSSGPESAYELPFEEKLEAARIVRDHDLELARFRRFEELVLLEVAWEELPPGERARFERVPFPVPYWEGRLQIPRPRAPRGRAAIVLGLGDARLAGEVGRTRAGHLVVVRVP